MSSDVRHETKDASNVSRLAPIIHNHSLAWVLTMPLPVFHRCGVVGVGVAVVAEVRAGVVLADVLGHDAAAGEALAFVLQAGVATLLVGAAVR